MRGREDPTGGNEDVSEGELLWKAILPLLVLDVFFLKVDVPSRELAGYLRSGRTAILEVSLKLLERRIFIAVIAVDAFERIDVWYRV